MLKFAFCKKHGLQSTSFRSITFRDVIFSCIYAFLQWQLIIYLERGLPKTWAGTCFISLADSMSWQCMRSMYSSCSRFKLSWTLRVTRSALKSSSSPGLYLPTLVATNTSSRGRSLMHRPRSCRDLSVALQLF